MRRVNGRSRGWPGAATRQAGVDTRRPGKVLGPSGCHPAGSRPCLSAGDPCRLHYGWSPRCARQAACPGTGLLNAAHRRVVFAQGVGMKCGRRTTETQTRGKPYSEPRAGVRTVTSGDDDGGGGDGGVRSWPAAGWAPALMLSLTQSLPRAWQQAHSCLTRQETEAQKDPVAQGYLWSVGSGNKNEDQGFKNSEGRRGRAVRGQLGPGWSGGRAPGREWTVWGAQACGAAVEVAEVQKPRVMGQASGRRQGPASQAGPSPGSGPPTGRSPALGEYFSPTEIFRC